MNFICDASKFPFVLYLNIPFMLVSLSKSVIRTNTSVLIFSIGLLSNPACFYISICRLSGLFKVSNFAELQDCSETGFSFI